MKTISALDHCSVDNRRKHIEKHAFSNENALVFTGPDINLSNYKLKVTQLEISSMHRPCHGVPFCYSFFAANYTVSRASCFFHVHVHSDEIVGEGSLHLCQRKKLTLLSL